MAKAGTSKSSQHGKSIVGPDPESENRGMESPPERPVRQRQRNFIRPTAAGAQTLNGKPAMNRSDDPPHATAEAARSVASNDDALGPDPTGEAPDYTVGYRRPPRHTQFRKGQSGNPAGRPRGSKNFQSIYLQERDARIGIKENGQRMTFARVQATYRSSR